MKVLVTGGRNHSNAGQVFEVLEQLVPTHIIVGDCPTGVDAAAVVFAKARHIPVDVYRAEWGVYGCSAGPRRNEAMLRDHPDALVVAFPTGGPGTKHCINAAKRRGMEVRVEEFRPNRG